jgi:hypothetical protein
MAVSQQHLETLSSGAYTACDISDALLKLRVPHAGFLVDIGPSPPLPISFSPLTNNF